jgi:hypothetical protein
MQNLQFEIFNNFTKQNFTNYENLFLLNLTIFNALNQINSENVMNLTKLEKLSQSHFDKLNLSTIMLQKDTNLLFDKFNNRLSHVNTTILTKLNEYEMNVNDRFDKTNDQLQHFNSSFDKKLIEINLLQQKEFQSVNQSLDTLKLIIDKNNEFGFTNHEIQHEQIIRLENLTKQQFGENFLNLSNFVEIVDKNFSKLSLQFVEKINLLNNSLVQDIKNLSAITMNAMDLWKQQQSQQFQILNVTIFDKFQRGENQQLQTQLQNELNFNLTQQNLSNIEHNLQSQIQSLQQTDQKISHNLTDLSKSQSNLEIKLNEVELKIYENNTKLILQNQIFVKNEIQIQNKSNEIQFEYMDKYLYRISVNLINLTDNYHTMNNQQNLFHSKLDHFQILTNSMNMTNFHQEEKILRLSFDNFQNQMKLNESAQQLQVLQTDMKLIQMSNLPQLNLNLSVLENRLMYHEKIMNSNEANVHLLTNMTYQILNNHSNNLSNLQQKLGLLETFANISNNKIDSILSNIDGQIQSQFRQIDDKFQKIHNVTNINSISIQNNVNHLHAIEDKVNSIEIAIKPMTIYDEKFANLQFQNEILHTKIDKLSNELKQWSDTMNNELNDQTKKILVYETKLNHLTNSNEKLEERVLKLESELGALKDTFVMYTIYCRDLYYHYQCCFVGLIYRIDIKYTNA